MTSTAQIHANRENAQHSTGPKTEEGKRASSANAARHNLTARGIIIPAGQEAAFAELNEGLFAELLPTGGTLQMVLFKRIVECAWNLERCRLAQSELAQSGLSQASDPMLDLQNEAKLARIDKYARGYENSMYKAIRQLRQLQTDDLARGLIGIKPNDPQGPILCDIKKAAETNRVVSSNSRIQNEANRDAQTYAHLERRFAEIPGGLSALRESGLEEFALRNSRAA